MALDISEQISNRIYRNIYRNHVYTRTIACLTPIDKIILQYTCC